MGQAAAVTDESFQSDVLEATEPTLVDFWAEWCGPCKMIGPIVEEIAGEYPEKLHVLKMDVDTNPKTPQSLGIRGIPTLILFDGGVEVKRIVGFRTKEALVEELQPYVE